jgi:hypothetical protein
MTARKPVDLTVPSFGDEAKSYERDISATRDIVGDWLRWLRVPPVSGVECTAILRSAGFTFAKKMPGCIVMVQDDLLVEVPLSERLDPDVFVALLIKARIGPARFFELFDDPGMLGPGHRVRVHRRVEPLDDVEKKG